jgi:hypothetical protein
MPKGCSQSLNQAKTAAFPQTCDIPAKTIATPIPARMPDGLVPAEDGIWLGD